MKLLLDENLSYRLVSVLKGLYPGSAHVRETTLLGSSDETIWRYAQEHDFVLVSKDADFYQRSLISGAPPKVIWLRVGNASTDAISKLLREKTLLIRHFVDDAASSFLVLGESGTGIKE